MKKISTQSSLISAKRGYQHLLVAFFLFLAGAIATPTEAWAQCETNTPAINNPVIADNCLGDATASLTYDGVVNGAIEYRIQWNSGLTPMTQFETLPASPITISGTGSLAASTYTGTLYVRNSEGCISGTNISLTIYARPTVEVNSPTICADDLPTTVTATPAGTATDYTYTWTVPAGATDPGNVSTFSTNIAGTYSVVITNITTGCSSASASGTVTVNPQPTITAPTIASICPGDATASLTYGGTTDGANQYRIQWNSGLTSMTDFQALPSSPITISGTGALAANTYTGIIYVRNSTTGCESEGVNISLTVNPTPTVTVNSPVLCADDLPTTVFATPGSDVASDYNYSWTVPTGATDPGNVSSFTTSIGGVYSVIATNKVSGCSSASASGTVTVNPQPTITAPTIASICPGDATASLTYGGTTDGANQYRIQWNSGLTSMTDFQALPSSPITISGTGALAANTYTGIIYVRNSTTGCESEGVNISLTVTPTPTVTVNSPTICFNSLPATVTATPGSGAAADYNYSWTVPAGAAAPGNVASFTTSIAGSYSVVITNKTTGCPSASESGTVTINQNPTVTVNSPTVCANTLPTIVTATTGSGSAADYNYSWVVPAGAAAPGNVASFTTSIAGSYSVVITNKTTGCPSASESGTVTINPLPTATISGTTAVCQNAASPNITFTGANGTAPYTFTYTLNGGAPQTITTTSGNSITLPAPTATSGTFTYTLTEVRDASSTTCSNTASGSAVITVNPLPATNAIENRTHCAGASGAAIAFSSPESGTATYAWTSSANIGFGTAGTGNIPAYTAANAGTAPVTATISVRATINGCQGPAQTFTITVNPLPATTTITNRTHCSGVAATAIAFSSPVSGATFAWTSSADIGFGTSGTGNIPAYTASNTGTQPITATVTVRATANGCPGPDQSFTITVNPRPQLSSSLTPAAICSGTTFSYTPTSDTPGATYSWSRTLPQGVSGSGGNTGSGNISQTLTNTTPNPQTVTYTFTTTANGCAGTATQVVSVVVNPRPVLSSALTGLAVCSSGTFTYTPTSATAGATFNWSRAAVAGISNAAASGTGSISETLVNTTTAAINVTYVFTTTANECTGTAQNVVVRVNPTPALSSTLTPVAICSGTNFNYSPTSATSGATYAWTRAAVEGITTGAPTSGVGSISGHNFVNTTTQPIAVTYVFRVTANNCQGPEENVVFTVNPSPVLSSSLDPVTLCSGDAFNYAPSSETPGATFTWSRTTSNALGSSQPPTSGTGTITNHGYTNTTNAPITITYTYRATANGCQGPAQAIAVTINPNPVLNSVLTSTAVCTGSTFAYTPTSAIAGATITWSRAAVDGIENPAVTNATGAINETLVNTTSSPLAVTYAFTTTANGCTGAVQNRVVTVNPLPVVSFSGIADDATLYSGQNPITLTGSPTGGVFSGPGISRNNQGVWSFSACNALGNSAEETVTITYTATSGGCTNTISKTVTVKRSTFTVVVSASPFTVCRGENINFTATVYRDAEVIYPYLEDPESLGTNKVATYNPAYDPYLPDGWLPIHKEHPARFFMPVVISGQAMDPSLFTYQWVRNDQDRGRDRTEIGDASLSATDFMRVKIKYLGAVDCIEPSTDLINGELWSNAIFFSQPKGYMISMSAAPSTICQGGTTSFVASLGNPDIEDPIDWNLANTNFRWILRRGGTDYLLQTISASEANPVTAADLELTVAEINAELTRLGVTPAELIDGDQVFMEFVSDIENVANNKCNTTVNTSTVSTVIVNDITASVEEQNPIICAGESATFTVDVTSTGTAPVSYVWTVGTTTYTTTEPSLTVENLPEGEYAVSVNVSNTPEGATTACEVIPLEVGSLLVRDLKQYTVAGGGNYCALDPNAQTITLSDSQIGASYHLYWTPEGGEPEFVETKYSDDGEPITFTPQTKPGTYTVEGNLTAPTACEKPMLGSAVITIDESSVRQAELTITEVEDGNGYSWIVEAPSPASPGNLSYGDNPIFIWKTRDVTDDPLLEWEDITPVQTGPSNIYIERNPSGNLEIRAEVVNSAGCILNIIEIIENPLPVTMLYFRAQKQGADVVLDWATAAEENNTGFEVQVSTDGSEYKKLAFVPTADGNATSTQTYKYTDREPGKYGTRYYRLMQIDIDGTSEYFGPQLVVFETTDQLAFYPNPFQSLLQLNIQAEKSGTLEIRIFSAGGKRVLESSLEVEKGVSLQEITLDPGLPRGVYFVTTQMGGVIRHFKLMKQ
jgi:hypothetical protein